LAYTIQVTNNGPAVAHTVVATDTLPSAVTYVSSSTTQGSCVQAGVTVTCTIGTMSVGQVVIVTINVTASTFSSATLATNSVTITHTDPDPQTPPIKATFTSTIQASTAVQLASFQALRLPGGGVVLESVEVNGTRATHGPAAIEDGAVPREMASTASPMLSQMNQAKPPGATT